MRRTAILLLRSIAALVVLCTASVCVAQPAGEAVVPNMIGMSLEAAQDTLRKLRLDLGAVRDSASYSEPGLVVGQDPLGGREVAAGDPVRLWIAAPPELGEDRIEVPNVLERDLGEATEIIIESGLRRGDLSGVPSRAEPGIVVRQNPPPGEMVPPETSVNLVISVGGEERGEITVPNVIGRRIGEAEEIIREAGLGLGRVSGSSPGAGASRVARQDPPPRTTVPEGSAVNLVLAAPGEGGVPWVPIIGGFVVAIAVLSFLASRPARVRRRRQSTGRALELNPVLDPGSQEVRTQGPLVGDERGENG